MRIWNGLTLEEDPVAVIEEALTEAAPKWSANGPDSIAYRPKLG